jgi:hypothetical protein
MKFCQPHWDSLRKAIDDRGLSDLVAPDAETAGLQMAQEFEQGPSAVTYDPLMAAHWAIVNNVGDLVPGGILYLMAPDEDGSERCPLCVVNEGHRLGCAVPGCTFTYDDWVDHAADDQLAHVEKLRAEGVPADG